MGIRGSYNTHIYTVKSDPPKYCQYEGEVRGKSALITGDARINLSEDEDKCLVNYRAEGIITGALSHVNSRYIEGISQNLIKLGFRKMDRKLNSMQ